MVDSSKLNGYKRIDDVLTGFPRSWKIIENPGKINFPGKSWKSHGKLIKLRKSWKN